MKCEICGGNNARPDFGLDDYKGRWLNGKIWVRCINEYGRCSHSQYRMLTGDEWIEAKQYYDLEQSFNKFVK